MWRAGLLKRHLGVFRVVQLATTTWNWLRTTPNSETNQWWNSKEIKSENSNVSQNLRATLHQFQQKVKQRNPYELQPSNTIGRSKRGAHQLIPENEVGHSPTRVSTGSQLIDNIKIRWSLDMRLRGVYINCELMREAQFYSQLHGEPQWELSSQVSLSAKRDLTRQLKSTRWSRRCNETKMTIVEMPCNTNWFGTPYLIVSRSLSTEIHVLGMAKKKNIKETLIWRKLLAQDAY